MSDPITLQMRIAMAEAASSVKKAEGIEAKFKAAANVTRGHWMCTDEDQQFRAAVGAVMIDYGASSPEFARIDAEMTSIEMLNAIITAAQSGVGISLPDELPDFERVGLLDMWREGA